MNLHSKRYHREAEILRSSFDFKTFWVFRLVCRTIFFFALIRNQSEFAFKNVIIGKQKFCEVLSILKRFEYFDWLSYHIFLRIESGTKALNGQPGYAFAKRDGPEQNLVVPGHRAHAVSNTANECSELHRFWKECWRTGKRTKIKQTELPKSWKQLSYDGDLSPCQVWIQLAKAFSS